MSMATSSRRPTSWRGRGSGCGGSRSKEGLLARAAALGVEVWEGTEAMGFSETAGGVTLRTSRGDVEADWLVAADGLHSRVRKEAGIAVRTGPTRRLGIRRHYTVRPWSPYVEVHWGMGWRRT